MRAFLSLLLLAVGAAPAAWSGDAVKSVELPGIGPVDLEPYSALDAQASIEPSGMVKSRTWPGVFWSLNDSGDIPRLFPVFKNGDLYNTEEYVNHDGVMVSDGANVDWEDIAIDGAGHIIIGDVGNRAINNRRDFCLIHVLEPHPETSRILVFKKVFFTYPDYTGIPAVERNFDCEGIFWAKGKTYILTKHRGDTLTKLYRLDSEEPFTVNVLTYLDTFDIQGQATAADADESGGRLAVLTYNAVWMFESRDGSDNYFGGRIWWLPIEIGQCEAMCFDGESLIISSVEHKGFLYEIRLDDLIPVRE